jgi:hypothetical protein
VVNADVLRTSDVLPHVVAPEIQGAAKGVNGGLFTIGFQGQINSVICLSGERIWLAISGGKRD